MIPGGYVRKCVSARPVSIQTDRVVDIYSASSCISSDFANDIGYWRHNGFWLFNDPSDMDDIAAAEGKAITEFGLFYYELYEQQYDVQQMSWSSFAPEPSFETKVKSPVRARLEGFDVVSFSLGTDRECSPLSCNSLADELPVNAHCLFESFEEAKAAIEEGKFNNTEPGPFRIFAVYSVED